MSDPSPPSVLKRKVPWWIWLPTTLLLSCGVVYLKIELTLAASRRAHHMSNAYLDSISAEGRRADSALKALTPPIQRELTARMVRLCDAMRASRRESTSLDLDLFTNRAGLVEDWVGKVYLRGSSIYLMNSPVDFRHDSAGNSLRAAAEPLDRRAARFTARLLSTGEVDPCLATFPIKIGSLTALDVAPPNAATHH